MISQLEKLKLLLWEEWDPIGVNDAPEAQYEYDAYAFEMWMKLQRGASVEDIQAYLDWVVVEQMGLTADAGQTNRPIAQKVLALVQPET